MPNRERIGSGRQVIHDKGTLVVRHSCIGVIEHEDIAADTLVSIRLYLDEPRVFRISVVFFDWFFNSRSLVWQREIVDGRTILDRPARNLCLIFETELQLNRMHDVVIVPEYEFP